MFFLKFSTPSPHCWQDKSGWLHLEVDDKSDEHIMMTSIIHLSFYEQFFPNLYSGFCCMNVICSHCSPFFWWGIGGICGPSPAKKLLATSWTSKRCPVGRKCWDQINGDRINGLFHLQKNSWGSIGIGVITWVVPPPSNSGNEGL